MQYSDCTSSWCIHARRHLKSFPRCCGRQCNIRVDLGHSRWIRGRCMCPRWAVVYSECEREMINRSTRPQIRMHMADQFSLWGPAQHEIEQHCNWPYSNEACLNASDRSRCPVMSQAFLEHITSPRNWTNGHNKFVSPSMGRIGVPAEM